MPKTAYLTIDDAPSPHMSEKVAYLAERGIPAIFFCRGDFLERLPQEGVNAVKKGFVLGNHAYSHKPFSSLTLEEAREEIARTEKIINDVYRQAGVERPARLFRFPYGDKGEGRDLQTPMPLHKQLKTNLQALLRDMGFRLPKFENITYPWYVGDGLHRDADIYWTYDVLDWCLLPRHLGRMGMNTPADLRRRMDEHDPETGLGLNDPSSGEIILTHDHWETHGFFADIIEHLLAKGLDFQLPNLKS